MNALATPFRQLVERRLWPIALLLIAALAAVPMLLAKDAAPVIPGPVASAANASGATKAIVSLGNPAEAEAHRHVLGDRKNPFRPAVKAHKAQAASTDTGAAAAPSTGGSSGSQAPGVSAGGGTPVVVGPGVTPTVKRTYELHSLTVRFGPSSSSADNPKQTLKRLTGLPSALPGTDVTPLLIYLGLMRDNKTAVFLVDAGAKVQGDGKCSPGPDDCQTVRLKVGDTLFVDAPDGSVQYEMDLVKIHSKKTTDAKAAKVARTSTADGGRDALRAQASRLGRWVFDARTGTLERLTSKAFKARVARASARAAAATS